MDGVKVFKQFLQRHASIGENCRLRGRIPENPSLAQKRGTSLVVERESSRGKEGSGRRTADSWKLTLEEDK